MKLNKKILNLITLAISVVFLCVFYATVLYETPFFASPRLKLTDSLFYLRSQHPLSDSHLSDIVVIGADDDSYEKMNRVWPWGREIFSVFLENLTPLHPKTVGLDFSFKGQSSNGEVDRWFSEALRKTPQAVIATYFSPAGKHMTPLKILEEAASGTGFVDKKIDVDSAARKTRIVTQLRDGGGPVYSFSAQVACRFEGVEPSQAISVHESSVVLDGRWKVTDREDYYPLSYRYKPSDFKYIPFWRVVANQVDLSEISGKVVLVGLVSDLFHDVHNTPLGRMPGIFINANETVSILDRDFIHELFKNHFLGALLIWAIFITGFFYLIGFWVRVATLPVFTVALYSVSAYLFMGHNVMIESFSFIFITILVFVLVESYEGIGTWMENQVLQRLVIMDALTGLYTYGYMDVRLGRELGTSLQTGEEFCFVMLDIDRFKQVNDRFGHEQGNIALTTVTRLVKEGVRGKDVVARYGGDEICLIVKAKTEDSVHCLERILEKVRRLSIETPLGPISLTVSAGVCSNKHPKVKSKSDLIALADQALYDAKCSGRDRVCVCS